MLPPTGAGYDLPRKPLPGTSVNKARRGGFPPERRSLGAFLLTSRLLTLPLAFLSLLLPDLLAFLSLLLPDLLAFLSLLLVPLQILLYTLRFPRALQLLES
jgi:hypothetical protein